MKTIAIANAKGGTGKTTTAVHLAVGLAKEGRRVLLADLDPQGSATAWLMGLDGAEGSKGTAEALQAGRILDEHVHQVEDRPGLELMPATAALPSADLVLANEVAGETILRRAFEKQRDRWDFVVLDCPPNIGLTVVSALCASDGVIAPVLGAYLSLAGLRRLEETVSRIRERLDVHTKVLGYVLFAADPREAITAEARDILKKEAGGKLFRAEVRVSTAAKALPARRETAWDEASADVRGAEDYRALLRETLMRLDGSAASSTRRRAKGA